MEKFIKKIKAESGVSLIELIASVAIFAFLVLLASQIFKMTIDGQRNSISAQNVQENMRYALEKMSKEIRMAQISNQGCESIFSPPPAAIYKVYNTAAGDTKLYFKDKDGRCVAYYLENNRLKATTGSGGPEFTDYITPGKIQVGNLKFLVVDNLIGDLPTKQPYVTMIMDVKASGPAEHEQKIKIQTTISSRYYE